jgi:hypothetical protein
MKGGWAINLPIKTPEVSGTSVRLATGFEFEALAKFRFAKTDF